MAMPVNTTGFVPTLRTSRGERGANTSSKQRDGATRRPASSAVYPRENCRYWVRRNMAPRRANITRAVAPIATLKRRVGRSQGQHGVVAVTLPGDEAAEEEEPGAAGAEDDRRGPGPVGRLDDPPQQHAESDDRQHRADRVRPLGLGVLGVRDQECRGDQPGDGDGHVDEEDRAPPVVGPAGSRRGSGPMATPSPAVPDQMPMALARSRGPR